ncbi:MAG: OmpA family protein [Bacteroidota bacterium]
MKIFSLIIPLITALVFGLSAMAQDAREEDPCGGTDSKKAQRFFDKAMDKYYDDRKQAQDLLIKAVAADEDFADAYYVLADIALRQYQKSMFESSRSKLRERARKLMVKVVEICPGYDDYYLHYRIGEGYYLDGDFEEATSYLQTYIKHADEEQAEYSAAEEMIAEMKTVQELKNKPVPFNPEPVGGISTREDEFLPLISPDGDYLFYTRRYMKSSYDNIYGDKMTEEFTRAERADSTYMVYENPTAMPPPFNLGNNQGGISITIDNAMLFVTQCEFVSRDYKNCDIYVSHKYNGGWTELENLGPKINGKNTWESQPTISPDGKTLFFASIRPENLGTTDNHQSSDIYYSELQEDGSWSKAKNIGRPVNTDGNEKSPFFHADNKTLYFSSDRHAGIGGYDIFYSQYIDSAWQEPINIGYPINTENDDLGFVVNTAGNRAYFASNQLQGKGGYDIYGFRLHEKARPDKVLFVKGQLIDEEGNPLAEANVEIKNIGTNQISEGLVNDETGDYAVAVRMEEEKKDDYIMLVKKENYSFTSKYIDPEEIDNSMPVQANMEVKPIEKGQAVKINDIRFAFASAEFDQKSKIVLDNFIEFLNENPNIIFEIRGHTDNVGDNSANMELSLRRAKSVYDYLASHGIDESRMDYEGFGQTRPVATNETEEGRAQNRRTEFYIVNY